MEKYFLIWLGILVIGTIIGYIIMKNVIKTLVTFLFIIFLFAAITVTLTYSDIQELKTEIAQRENVILVQENQELMFSAVQTHEKELKELEIPAAEQEQWVKEKDYKQIQEAGEYYKVIVMSRSIFAALEEKNGLLETMENKALPFEERAEAYETLIAVLEEKEGEWYLIKEYKEGNIEVSPKTMFFRVLSVIPSSWIEKLLPESSES